MPASRSGAAAEALTAAAEPSFNRLMALPAAVLGEFRAALSGLLRSGSPAVAQLQADLVPQSAAEYDLPAQIGNYTDFYASIHHATSVGRLFRPTNPLTPNYRWMPIAYHGRASSIGVSEQEFHRPCGQSMPAGAERPVFGPSTRLDYELEIGCVHRRGESLGEAIAVASAEHHVFGLCLLNDWSARDLQSWEAQPLGPFLGKNFATTISPWVVTLEALAPFRAPLLRAPDEAEMLGYFDSPEFGHKARSTSSWRSICRPRPCGERARRPSGYRARISRRLLEHCADDRSPHGRRLQFAEGDLLGTGTQSGPTPAEAGSLLELSVGGTKPITLSDGETRTFLADGDRVELRAACLREGFARIGFGTASGTVLKALSPAI
jgi:fumarylacetoacetase